MKALMQRFWSDDSGQGLTEYALIIGLVSIGLLLVLGAFRDSIGGLFNRITAALNGVAPVQVQP